MYIKFCSLYGEDKKDKANLSSESELTVELQGEKDQQPKGNLWMYRVACALLTVICLVLLLIVIVLSMKSQTGSTVCPERGEITTSSKKNYASCTFDQCQDLFPNIQLQYLGCRQCADGWLTFGRSCFFLSTLRLPWDESQKDCRSRGGSLAVISSPEIQNFLTMKGNLLYWVGLRQRGHTWSWVNNTALEKSYWADRTSEGDCGLLSSDGSSEKNWMKAPCQSSSFYICQLVY